MPPDSLQTNTLPFRSKPSSSDAMRVASSHPETTLDEFAAEGVVVESAVVAPDPDAGIKIRFDRRTALTALLVLLVVATAAAGAFWVDRWQPTAAAASGSLRVESDPAGAEVRIGQKVVGTTPLTVMLASGNHALTVTHANTTKQLTVEVTPGIQTVHHITWADVPAAPTTQTGGLFVSTDSPGATVTIDGVDRGTTPLTLNNLGVGRHEVLVRSASQTQRRTVMVQAGATASLVISRGNSPVSGWMTVTAPTSMQIFEDGRLIGSTDVRQIMLPTGDHTFEFVSDAIGYRTNQTVRIVAGQTEMVELQVPRAPVSINAVPWAEVSIDGVRVGETPLANLMQTVGAHEIVFRHPQHGEKRVSTMVTLKDTARVSVDMRTK